jgi:hypothetical protein
MSLVVCRWEGWVLVCVEGRVNPSFHKELPYTPQYSWPTIHRGFIFSYNTLESNVHLKECKKTIKTLSHPCLLQPYSSQPSYGNSQDALQLLCGLRGCVYIHTLEYYSATKKNEIFVFCR